MNADSFKSFFSGVGGFSFFASMILLFIYCARRFGDDVEQPSLRKYGISLLLVFGMAMGISTAIPSTKNLMYIVGAYAVTNIKGVEKLPENLVGAANKFLEEYGEALKE